MFSQTVLNCRQTGSDFLVTFDFVSKLFHHTYIWAEKWSSCCQQISCLFPSKMEHFLWKLLRNLDFSNSESQLSVVSLNWGKVIWIITWVFSRHTIWINNTFSYSKYSMCIACTDQVARTPIVVSGISVTFKMLVSDTLSLNNDQLNPISPG